MYKKVFVKGVEIALTVLATCLMLSGCGLSEAREQFRQAIVSDNSEKEKKYEVTKEPDNSRPMGEILGDIADNIGNMVGEKLDEVSDEIGTSLGEGLDSFSKDFGDALGTGLGNAFEDNVGEKKGDGNEVTLTVTNSPDSVVDEKDMSDVGKTGLTDIPIPTWGLSSDVPEGQQDSDEPILEGPYHVAYCYDGDTVRIQEWEGVRVRLIGIDTPESVASDEYLEKSGKQNTQEGKDASSFMKAYFPQDKVDQNVVFIERDIENTDRYGRELVYLYAEKDGELVFVNELLLREGYAKLFTLQPNTKYSDNKFFQAQKYARENGKGFWGTGFFEE